MDATAEQVVLIKTKTNRPRVLSWRTPGGDMRPVLALGNRHGFLFTNRFGRPYAQFANNFIQLAERVKREEAKKGRSFRRFRAHDLRHGCAIRWLRAGGSIHRLSKHLGHTELSTTEVYLAYLTAEEQERVKAAA